jgi:hypothetical protein
VLVAMGAALEGMIYAVAAYCVLRLRGRLPDHHRPFRVPLVRVLAIAGIVVFGVLGLVASVSVSNRFDPLPLAIIVVSGGLSALYTVRRVPRLRAAEAARRAATGRRRPARAPGATPTGVGSPVAAPPAPAGTPPPGTSPTPTAGPPAPAPTPTAGPPAPAPTEPPAPVVP